MREPAEEAIRAVVAWGWQVSYANPGSRGGGGQSHGKPGIVNMGNSQGSYTPAPVDLKNVALSRDMTVRYMVLINQYGTQCC